MDANQYYQNLLQQGHSQVDAAHFTSQYYPGFQPPMQGSGMMAPQPTGMEMGAMEFGGMASSGMGAPAGFGAGMGAGGMGAGGMATGAGMAATGAAVGGGMSFATIAVVSVLVLGGAGTAGYFIYDSLSESEEAKPEFYGTVYWADYTFGWQFEEDGFKMVTVVNNSDDCEIYSESFETPGNIEYENGLCYIDWNYESYTSKNKGEYYEVCVTYDGVEDCTYVYAFDRGAVFYLDGDCDAIVSDISTPKYGASSDEMEEWMDEFREIADELENKVCSGLAETTIDGLDLYNFDGRDAAGSPSSSFGEPLVHIQMVAGDENLSWAVVKISISVDGGMVMQCDRDGYDDDNSDCVYILDASDNFWNVAEEITIAEGDNVDLCGGECEVRVTIFKLGEGSEDDRVLDQVYAFADAGN